MLSLILVGIIAAMCSADNPSERVVGWNGNGSYGLAVDFFLPSPDINATVFRCLREAGFTIVFLP
ncbi:hypothetical protein GCK32_021026 [Trichostrongylus colubriformis]|uniref:Uncharacterized protein n=1 Tax=Trichostrongylus colubriformis TaxID=6319 RepID=A0AAN8F6W9_TRICO